jgi:hypothetical protein
VRAASVAFLVLAWAALDARADPPTSPLTDEERAFFVWWDGLGYPDLGKLEFVRLCPGGGAGTQDGSWSDVIDPAFLISSDADAFTVFQTDLATIRRQRETRKGFARVGFERADLQAYVCEGLERARKSGPSFADADGDPFAVNRWQAPGQAFRAAVLARACAARGLDDLAHRLCVRAREEAHERSYRAPPVGAPRPEAPMSAVREGLLIQAEHLLKVHFADAERSWADLLAEHEAWAPRLSGEARSETEATLSLLREGVADAARRSSVSLPPPRDDVEAARRLVGELRDVAVGFGNDERPYFPMPSLGRDAPRAHERLLSMNTRAVPALIAALDDVRLTRCVEHLPAKGTDPRKRARVLRLGEFAWMILNRISSGELDRLLASAPTSSRRAVAQRWFESVRGTPPK